MLLEKCQPLRDASLPQQEQLCHSEADYSLEEHNYVAPTEAHSQLTLMQVKQESYNDSSPLSDLKQEKEEPPVACGQVLNEKPGFAQATSCGTENEGPLINPECSTGETPLPQKDTHMALETSGSGMCSGLQGFPNQSPSLVISVAAIKDMDEEPEVGLKISEVGTQAKLLPYDNYPLVAAQHQSEVGPLENEQLSVVPQQCQREGETPVNEQTNVQLQRYKHVHDTREQVVEPTSTRNKVAHEKQKIGMAESVASSYQVCRKRGRPPKRAKQLHSPKECPAKPEKISSVIAPLVQETVNIVLKLGESRKVDSLPDSVVSSSIGCLSEKKKTSESQKNAIEAPFSKDLSEPATLNTPRAESAQASSVQPKERHTSVPLQDAMLLVEAMNQSTIENTAPLQTKCAPHVQSLQNAEENPTEQRTPLTHEVAGKLLTAEPSTLTQSTVKTLCAAPQTTDATPPSKAQMHITAVIPNKQHVVTPSITTSSLQLPSSGPEMQRSVGSFLQHQPYPLSVGAHSNTVQSKIIIMPRSLSSLARKLVVLSSSQVSSVGSTVLASQTASLTPGSTIGSLPLGTPSNSSVPQETVYVVSTKPLPVVSSQSSTTSANQLAVTLPQPKVTVKISRPASSVISGTHHSQPITANWDSAATAASAAPAILSSLQLSSSSQKLSDCANAPIASDEMTDESPQKRDSPSHILESPKQAPSASETTNEPTETCSSFKSLVREPPVPVSPVLAVKKYSAVVKLTRLPFPMSTNESVLVSKFLSNTLDLDEEVISSTRSNEPTAEEKQFAAPLQLTSVTSQAISDSHLQSTKTQFLAQLAVSPIDEAQKKASADTDAKASYAKTSCSRKKKLQKYSFGAQPESHSKPPVQIRIETNLEPCIVIENTVAKEIRLENDSPNDKNTNSEPSLVSLKKTGVVEEVPSVIKNNKDPTPIHPMRSGQCNNDVRQLRIVSEVSVSPRKSKAFSESTPVGPRGFSSRRDDKGCKNKKSSSVSPKRSTSCKDDASLKMTKSTFLSPQMVSSKRHGASDKKTKSASVSPKRTYSTRDGASPAKTKSTSMSPNRSRSSREAASPKKTKSTSFSPRSKNAASPKVSTNESVPGSHRRSTLTNVGPSIKQLEKDSNSFKSRVHSIVTHSASTKISKNKAGFSGATWPKLTKDGVGSKRAGESTPAKKPRLVEVGTSPIVVGANKLTKVVKAKTVAKIREPENQATCEAMKSIRTQAVWIPPRMPASKTSSVGGKSSSPLAAKKETRSPSVPLHSLPVKASPIVSPLQPLLVIGKHLLKNQCGACGRVLSSIAALESHVSLHTGNRPFSCSFCGKTFPDSKSFKRHDRVHRNGRIHVCKHCGKGFVYRFGLSKHLRMVHSRIRPFICQICNKGFYAKRDVEAHIRIHTGEKPFHCNLCEKKFRSRVKLNVHFRWHNGEKRHWCPYCGKGFLDFNNLKRHKYIHTGEKPHSCPHCSKHFTQSGHLKKHVTNVHKIESD